jgi:hypothetical protein
MPLQVPPSTRRIILPAIIRPFSATFDSAAGMIKVFVQEARATGKNLTVIYTKDLKSAKDAKWENRRAGASFRYLMLDSIHPVGVAFEL